ncbi:hypothetical protein [Azospirillum sp. ST 5-10]|uniref:hypothetical protein n=1 Tax=unclassified Azospirillum TaxID=2630922 RepID=UPI003F49EA50
MTARVLGGALAAAAALAMVLTWAAAPSPSSSSPAPPEAVSPAPPPPSLPSPALADFAAILDRPLFIPDRRPPAAPQPAAAPPARTPPFTLHGVIRSDRRQLVLLKPATRGAVVRAEPGDRVAGWEIVAVEPRAVTVRNGPVEVSLPLTEPGARAKP